MTKVSPRARGGEVALAPSCCAPHGHDQTREFFHFWSFLSSCSVTTRENVKLRTSTCCVFLEVRRRNPQKIIGRLPQYLEKTPPNFFHKIRAEKTRNQIVVPQLDNNQKNRGFAQTVALTFETFDQCKNV